MQAVTVVFCFIVSTAVIAWFSSSLLTQLGLVLLQRAAYLRRMQFYRDRAESLASRWIRKVTMQAEKDQEQWILRHAPGVRSNPQTPERLVADEGR